MSGASYNLCVSVPLCVCVCVCVFVCVLKDHAGCILRTDYGYVSRNGRDTKSLGEMMVSGFSVNTGIPMNP